MERFIVNFILWQIVYVWSLCILEKTTKTTNISVKNAGWTSHNNTRGLFSKTKMRSAFSLEEDTKIVVIVWSHAKAECSLQIYLIKIFNALITMARRTTLRTFSFFLFFFFWTLFFLAFLGQYTVSSIKHHKEVLNI